MLVDGQGILFSISAIWLINSTPHAIDYFNSRWCVIEQFHATRHPLDYILVTRAYPHLFQRSMLSNPPNSSYRKQIFMHHRSIDLSSHIFAGIARGVTGKRQHSWIKSNVFIGIVTALPAKYLRGSQEVLRPCGLYCNYYLSSSCAVWFAMIIGYDQISNITIPR